MSITQLNHITFICQDLAKSAHFFKQVLGAREIYDSGAETHSIAKEKFLLIGETWIALMEGEPLPRSYNHVAFSVAEQDLSALKQKVEALGLSILPSRPRAPAEGQSLYFYDYDNHLFELNTGNLNERLQYYHSAEL